MADKSKIEWCDATWNPITGCTPVSPACENCYASRQIRSGRTPAVHGSTDFSSIRIHLGRMKTPLRWRKPRKIFLGSMTDIFHKDISDGTIGDIFDIMAMADHHTFMLLTKRPERMRNLLVKWDANPGAQPRRTRFENLWLGVTAENQETADQRIPILLQTPAAKRFVSIEPCIGATDISFYLPCPFCRGRGWYLEQFADNTGTPCPRCQAEAQESGVYIAPGQYAKQGPRLDWCIVGGESGPGARPMHPDWPRSLRGQCQAAGVPFFFKQWGNWRPAFLGETIEVERGVHEWNGGAVSLRVGKKMAGCLLDGREWKEFPA